MEEKGEVTEIKQLKFKPKSTPFCEWFPDL